MMRYEEMLPGLSLSVLWMSPLLQRYASQGKYTISISIFDRTTEIRQ